MTMGTTATIENTTTKGRQGRARRIAKAQAIVSAGGVRRWRGGHLVMGSTGSYGVEDGRCECEDFGRHAHLEGFACKHSLAVGIYEFSLQFGPVEIYPPSYPKEAVSAVRECPVEDEYRDEATVAA